ncbi:MAG: ATP-binding protein [Deltaproteobacteria bacterium]|nr:ATP-binding protein [Deltaproteobacteria bacterium]
MMAAVITKADHFLRPEMTRYIIQRLERGHSINLHGPPGLGKTRMLEDIRDGGIEGICVTFVSFRGYCASYGGFCRAVAAAGGVTGKTPDSMSTVVQELTRTGKSVFLLIDDFQYLPENPDVDPRFDQRFIEALNCIKNMSGISLLAVSLKPLHTLTLFIKQKPVTSVLNLDPVEVTPLSNDEIHNELVRRFPPAVLKKGEAVHLSSHLNGQERIYEMLEYYEPKILSKSSRGLDDEMLQVWLQQFKNAHKKSPTKRMSRFTNSLKRWNLVLNPIRPMFQQMKHTFQGPIGSSISWLKQFFSTKD